jgi:hypothetical protein
MHVTIQTAQILRALHPQMGVGGLGEQNRVIERPFVTRPGFVAIGSRTFLPANNHAQQEHRRENGKYEQTRFHPPSLQ